MTVIHRRISRIAARPAFVIHQPGPENRATAEFFVDQARAAMRQAKRFIARAEIERAGSTNKARGLLGLAIVELERACPTGSDEEE